MTKEREDNRRVQAQSAAAVSHVGGVNDDLGGVDPNVDANLVRLSGGP